ncbi:MAG: putative toxin-antitoxin system toxin component, PIN family [Burkholderiales bacterium]|nr:putative toxin-antitoxin system toxin component, PIN family [Burkholderiales bacterium]
MRPLVLDTNVVLDLLVFGDPRTERLRAALDAREVRWLATPAMRDELLHVMAYPNLAGRAEAAVVLAAFDHLSEWAADPLPSHVTCRDGDDQKFVDLAVAHRALLVSKDKDVLKLKRRLRKLEVEARAVFS